jgi:hypothetical protein
MRMALTLFIVMLLYKIVASFEVLITDAKSIASSFVFIIFYFEIL